MRDLEQRLQSAASKLASTGGVGQGADSRFGALTLTPPQVGFAAELTSAYNATTGYAWKRLALDTSVPAFVAPSVQPTGNQAFTVDDNRTLTAGTRVWIEPTPDGVGYVITSSTDANSDGGNCGPACGWIAGLNPYRCVAGSILSVAGDCACASTDDPGEWTPSFAWNAGDKAWVADETINICGTEYTVRLHRDHEASSGGGDPQLSLTTSGSAPVTYWATLDCCGEDFAVFAVGWPVCTAAAECPQTPCSDNVMRLKVQCGVCPNPDYHGPGWYCVTVGQGKSCSTPADTQCMQLLTDPGVCDPTSSELITICSGPHETEQVCRVNCGASDWYCRAIAGCGASDQKECVPVAVGAPPPSGTICSGPHGTAAACAAACALSIPCATYDSSHSTNTITESNRTASCDTNGVGGSCCPLPVMFDGLPQFGDPAGTIRRAACETNVKLIGACPGGGVLRIYTTDGLTEIDGTIVYYNADPYVLVVDFDFPDGYLCTAGAGVCHIRLTFT